MLEFRLTQFRFAIAIELGSIARRRISIFNGLAAVSWHPRDSLKEIDEITGHLQFYQIDGGTGLKIARRLHWNNYFTVLNIQHYRHLIYFFFFLHTKHAWYAALLEAFSEEKLQRKVLGDVSIFFTWAAQLIDWADWTFHDHVKCWLGWVYIRKEWQIWELNTRASKFGFFHSKLEINYGIPSASVELFFFFIFRYTCKIWNLTSPYKIFTFLKRNFLKDTEGTVMG